MDLEIHSRLFEPASPLGLHHIAPMIILHATSNPAPEFPFRISRSTIRPDSRLKPPALMSGIPQFQVIIIFASRRLGEILFPIGLDLR